MELLATAIIPPNSPSDIMLVPCLPGSSANRRGVAVARVSRPPLTAWLCTAINQLLAGASPDHPRPTGKLIECGAFSSDGAQVWAGDWYGHGHRLLVAQCPNAETAAQVAERLQTLLEGY